jgi:hypothetical protein
MKKSTNFPKSRIFLLLGGAKTVAFGADETAFDHCHDRHRRFCAGFLLLPVILNHPSPIPTNNQSDP